VPFEGAFTPSVNTLIRLDLAENPVTVSALHDERFNVGDFHMFLEAPLLIGRAKTPVYPQRFGA